MPLRFQAIPSFSRAPLHRRREPHAVHFLMQRTSFWIAALSLIAFVAGNMIGQHGWYAFWLSVLGADDSAIVYTGTVPPIAQVPDYTLWAQYGGDFESHTFRQVPANVLRTLPLYDASLQQRKDQLHGYGNDVYSVGYMGSYATGAQGDGSHPGVDIRTPVGTPIRAIANAIVDEVKEDPGGFGTVVVLRHPNVPDPEKSNALTTLYSSYAHLSAVYVTQGSVVRKGDHIADSGQSGLASGAHLHFQIDRGDAPWHPYWPFSTSEARSSGLSTTAAINAGFMSVRGYQYTVNPMLYVQANSAASTAIVRAQSSSSSVSVSFSSVAPKLTGVALLTAQRQTRLSERLERQLFSQRSIARASSSSSSVSQLVQTAVIRSTQTVVSADLEASTRVTSNATEVTSVEIAHDGSTTGRGWEKVKITLVDADGNTVTNPILKTDLALRTAYGTAEFRPSILSVLDFVNGEATVNMLPRGRRTVVIKIVPFNAMSLPMIFEKDR
ncbi:hypothetical protein COU80_03780 [Candidatus Peregrinibacteria bacterium CG10_big_fil_rev_8_21_14_0_10_55_24]|nr:MAG: hypothetical protein COU80_03780 [Candidatus Peregrinibacteria bacterium CG10_big_fil_rev_8_21_14_0_10_55_24]